MIQTPDEFSKGRRNIRVLERLEVMPRARRVNYKYKKLADLWFEHDECKVCEQMTFAPDREGEEIVGGMLNLWRGLAVKPRKGSWRRMLRHIWVVLADRDKERFRYIVRWLAWTLQNPGELPESVLAIVGDPGTGKSTIGKIMLKIFGVHGARPTSAKQVTGQFNYHLRDKCFLLMDEALNPESKVAANILKGLATDETISFEDKGRRAVFGRNRLSLIVISNEEHFVEVQIGDRRYVVFRVSSEHRRDGKWFKPLYAEIEQGGIEAMLHDLLNMDLRTWHPRDNIPETGERAKQMTLSYNGLDKVLHEILSSGYMPEIRQLADNSRMVRTQVLIEYAMRRFKVGVTSEKLAFELKRLGFAKAKDRSTEQNGYKFPALKDARSAWANLGRGHLWDDNVDEWNTQEREPQVVYIRDEPF